MPDVREREKCAADRRIGSKLLDIADEVSTTRHLVRASCMATSDLSLEQSNPLSALLAIIENRLAAIGRDLMETANAEDAADAA